VSTTDDHLQVRLYRQPVSRLWWLRRPTYLLFILRELSSLFVAWFVAYLLVLVAAVGAGESSYERFLDWSANPFVIALNVVALAFAVLHSVTFFQAAPQTTVVRLRGRMVPAAVRGQRVPAALLAGPIFAAWVVVSAFVIWLVVLA
jgi:succinate dehydrogenase subunit C